MPTPNRLNRERVEQAFAQFIIENKPGSTLADPDVQVLIRKGEVDDEGELVLDHPDEIPLPSIIVSCPRSKPHPGMGYPVCELHILLGSSVDEDNASVVASGRFGYLAELFPEKEIDEDKYAAVMTAMNKPASGPDNRTIKNFNVFGFYLMDDLGKETERAWVDHLVFEVHCVPTDDVDGDSAD